MPLFGHDPIFYDLLEKQADAAQRASRELLALSKDFSSAAGQAETLKRIEADADNLTHELANKADAKFITPFDKEDMHEMSVALDDLTDCIEATGARIGLYRLTTSRADFPPLVELLHQTTEAVLRGVQGIRNLKNEDALQKTLIQIHDMENRSDQLYRAALGSLFNESSPDPIDIIKWKDIYDRVEVAVDKCEDIAVILESVVIKYG